jgi:phosphoribosyl-ATP pyrophosphohydrolase/phosphoribosyl-AMP cyclohydrolase/histidinol dehydrogenase
MAPAVLAAIDLGSPSQASQPQGLNQQALSFVGSVFVRVTNAAVDQALAHLKQSVGRYANYLDVAALASTDDVLSLLDAGAAKVFVTRQQLDALLAAHVDQDRIVLYCQEAPRPR